MKLKSLSSFQQIKSEKEYRKLYNEEPDDKTKEEIMIFFRKHGNILYKNDYGNIDKNNNHIGQRIPINKTEKLMDSGLRLCI